MSTSPKLALLEEYARIARALSAPARLMILEHLAQGERAVEAVAERADLSVANCSQHLQHLRRAGLVDSRRAGKAVIYRLAEARTLALMELLRGVAERNLAQVGHILRGLSDGRDPPEPVSRSELAARLAEGSVVVLDLRPADEYATGHVPGARNISLAGLDQLVPNLPPDLEIIAYCRGPFCLYADQAVAILRGRGRKARRMQGGVPDWRQEGRPVHLGAET